MMEFEVNGKTYTETCLPGKSLLSLLRDLGWVGTKRVCQSGDCGSCTVWVDGEAVHSCIYPAMKIKGHQVTTIEGLASDGELSPMQQAFLEKQGFQCGFCTAGMIMSAEKLSGETEAEVRKALEGNLCRCTGYQAVVESIVAGKNSAECKVLSAEESAELKVLSAESEEESAEGSAECKVLSAELEEVSGGIENLTQNSKLKTQNTSVGSNIPKQDGPDIVTGKPVYTSDWTPSGLLHLKVLRSPHPHARILKINSDKAKAYPGVQAVFTYEDVPRIAYTTAGHAEPVPDPLDHYLLDNKVRYIGDRLAAVVADTPGIAELACKLIEVEYEILPHVIDPAIAMGENSPIIHDEPDSSQIPDRERNLAGKVDLDKGDIAQGFSEADFILENTYQLPAVQHTHLEPHVSISWLEEDGTLVVRSSTQVPFHCQRILSQILNYPQEQIRVYKAKIGGGFGNKQEVWTEDLCAFATLKLNRPVQWEFTREEELIASNTRHAMTIRLKTGVKADGTIVAQDLEAIANTGAYGNHASTVVFLTGYIPLNLYPCPHQRFRGRSIYTNTVTAGAFRGYGATQGSFAMESQLDEIALKLNLDPIELRRKNLIRPDASLTLGTTDDHFNLIGSYGLEQCLDAVTQAFNYVPGMPPIVAGNKRRGIGFAVSMQGSGLSKIHVACANLSLTPEGRYLLKTGSVDVGTGSDTTLRQIAAEVLAIAITEIDILAGDTHSTPFDAGSYASSTAFISGQAVNKAAQNLRQRLLEFGGKLLQTDPSLLELEGQSLKSPHQTLSLQQLATQAIQQQEPLEVEVAHFANESPVTFSVQGMEVEVDMETGRITPLRCVQAIDLGTALNPRICEGQVTGGIVMGLGYALAEELRLDERGEVINASLRTYRIPTAADVPPIEVTIVETADPFGPFGAKGVGEIATNCTAPAIANAVAHATGVRLRQLPMLPERVWKALNKL